MSGTDYCVCGMNFSCVLRLAECLCVMHHYYLRFSANITGFCRWEKYQSEEEAVLGRGKRQRKAVSYREAYAPHPSETLSEVIIFGFCLKGHDFLLFNCLLDLILRITDVILKVLYWYILLTK